MKPSAQTPLFTHYVQLISVVESCIDSGVKGRKPSNGQACWWGTAMSVDAFALLAGMEGHSQVGKRTKKATQPPKLSVACCHPKHWACGSEAAPAEPPHALPLPSTQHLAQSLPKVGKSLLNVVPPVWGKWAQDCLRKPCPRLQQ
jgi:hypothetical protein